MTRVRYAALGVVLLSWGCATSGAVGSRSIDVMQAQAEVPESQRLDVSIQILDPGIPDGTPAELEKQGIYPDVRRSEARFIPVHLKMTLEGTGHWGVVRVVPSEPEGAELFLSGLILSSNGKRLELELAARDATGRTWFERRYTGRADPTAYAEDQVDVRDPYQSLYNAIANDLVEFRNGAKAGQLTEVRQVAQLRFARDLAPEVFGEYLEADGDQGWSIARLPASGDPMLARVQGIRERDGAFVDTLNGHYSLFYESMSGNYDDWRMYSYVEQQALDELKKSSLLKRVLGGAAIVGAIFLDGNQDDRSGSSGMGDLARQAAILAGMAAIQSGGEDAAEAGIHRAALEELAASFDADVEPMLVDVEGNTTRLTGSAEAQFREWRQLLRSLFGAETGVPLDPNEAQTVGAPSPAGR